MKRYYTGVGSRQTPLEMLAFCTAYAEVLESYGLILRSGGASGADLAFERGVKKPENKIVLRPCHSTQEAETIASQIHPAWQMCNEFARKLHGRNVQLVLGEDLQQPSEFVVAWTLNGAAVGGTRTPLVLAQQRGVPTFNVAILEQQRQFELFLLNFKA